MNRRDEILAALADIEFLSSPATGAMAVLNNPDASPDEISRAISVDPALTSNILRFANSAYFGCPRAIHTVQEAVVRLGVSTISRMLYLSSARQFQSRPVCGYDLPAGSLWDSMLSTAVATDLFARVLGIRPPSYTFTAGLLHHIGKLILGSYLEIDAEPILRMVKEKNIPFDEAERQVLGIDHAEVGAELLRRWSIPSDIVDVVRWYLAPDQCPGEKTAVDLVHVANAVSLMAGSGLGIDGLSYDVCHSSEKRLGITSHVIEQVVCRLGDEVQQLT